MPDCLLPDCESSEAEAVAEAERAIDRVLAPKKLSLVRRDPEVKR